MHFTNTDLPVPEPPMMTRLSPVAQSMSRLSSTRLRPNDFRSPRTDIFGIAMSATATLSPTEEGRGDHVIEDENQDRGRHDRMGGCLADPLCPAARVIAVITPHQRHYEAEYRRFHEPRHNVIRFEILLGAI